MERYATNVAHGAPPRILFGSFFFVFLEASESNFEPKTNSQLHEFTSHLVTHSALPSSSRLLASSCSAARAQVLVRHAGVPTRRGSPIFT